MTIPGTPTSPEDLLLRKLGPVFLAGLLIIGALSLAFVAPFISAIPMPFAFSFLSISLVMLSLAFFARRSGIISGLFLSLFALCFGLCCGEAVFYVRGKFVPLIADKGTYGSYFNTADPDLGYAPFADRTVEDTRTSGGVFVFHATYTIGPGAFRVTRGNPAAAETDVFFGDSFTFGEGLEDNQTLPAQYSKARGYQTNIINLGFHGYGPHQMLRALETHRFDRYMTGTVKHVFYQTIGYHTERITGLAPWDPHGPRYILDEKTHLPSFTGKFSDHPFRSFDQKHPVLYRSLIIGNVVNMFGYRPSQGDIDLIVGIFVQSARIVKERYGADFTLLVWDYDPAHGDPTGAKIANEAEHKGVHVVRVTQLLPDWQRDFKARFLIPIDGHPNAYANEEFGKGLAAILH